MVVAVNIEYLQRKYFYKNKPVPYKLKCGVEIIIYPVIVEDGDIFEDSYDILTFNKSEIPIPEIIQMSYLQFLIEVMFKEDSNQYKLYNIFSIFKKIDYFYFIKLFDIKIRANPISRIQP